MIDQQRINMLRELQPDWDGHRGRPPTEAALKTASNIVVVPLSYGGLQIEMHAGGMDIEIEINSDGVVSSVYTAPASSSGN